MAKKSFSVPDADKLLSTAGGNPKTARWIASDCHNRGPSHVYLPVDDALDRKLLEGAIHANCRSSNASLAAVTASTPAARRPSRDRRGADTWYQQNQAEWSRRSRSCSPGNRRYQAAYAQNVFPEMNIGWATYVKPGRPRSGVQHRLLPLP